ncbi:unnamed protein product [Allacma fusca]|uniref:Peptidase S8/S53 domain-containing protein n=1 Tax=Allacma fusca TaxID=39272 RepID=A0A8J2JW55_9HEXA|nr:unnamed protein product [Allacma fusca]
MTFYNIFLVFVLAVAITTGLAAEVKVESSIYKVIEETGKANIFVSFKKNDIHSIRNQITVQKHVTRGDRINSLQEALKNHADTTQSGVLKAINSYRPLQNNPTVEISSFWITNQVYIKHADRNLVEQLSTLDDISEITQEKIFSIKNPLRNLTEVRNSSAEPQWGVAAIRAPEVWASGNAGSGVVVATIDTGVRGTHEALRDGFRKEKGWYDPIYGTLAPTDVDGHGTHVTGTIVGRTLGIGVAPGAQWIACRASDNDGNFPASAIIACAEWVACPYDSNGLKNCSLAPDVINNSWGGDREFTDLDYLIEMWESIGITVVFAAGNSGSGCGTVSSPGTHPKVISVGAIDENSRVTSFSSRGPSKLYGTVQPNVAAPGSKIFSASNSDDGVYKEMMGTSMAAPHVAGLAVLLKSARSNLTVSQIRRLIVVGAQPTVVSGQVCNGINDRQYPNNVVGNGKIDAPLSIAAIGTVGSSSLKVAAILKYREFSAVSLLVLLTLKCLVL